jgi:uncharacterized phage infection (PIP) family protein YhgE
MAFMWRLFPLLLLLFALLTPIPTSAIETAPPLSDREVIERLTRLEEGQKALQQGQDVLRADVQQLRQEMGGLRQEMGGLRQEMGGLRQEMGGLRQEMNTQMQQLRQDVNTQIQQLRTDMNAQFAHIFQLLVGMLGAFAAIVVATIGFAFWDRKTMMRPLDNRLKVVEEEIAQNRPRLHSLVEALRGLSQQDPRVADVLKQFDLL